MDQKDLIITLLSVIGFIGALGVRSLMTMAKDISEIKTTVNVTMARHDALVERVEKLENFIQS